MSEQVRERQRGERSLIPAEGNFEEHPYFRVGDRNAGTGVLYYQNELRTREGHVLEQSWVVRAATGRGLPGRFDQDVYVALLQLIDVRGMPESGWLSFSIYELVELMGRGHSGRDYQQVRQSLLRLSSTTIESNNAFYHGGKKRYITDSFSLLSQVKLAEYEDPEGNSTDRNAVLLSDYFRESYQANYLKNIDSRFYWSLSSPIAKRLYRLIDKKRAGRRTWEAELFSLKDRIPLSDYKYASKIKEKLAPAHAELISQQFLEEVGYRKAGKAEYAVYRISDSYQARRAIEPDSMSRDEIFCIKRLKAEGMSAETAEQMVLDYGTGRIMQYVEALPHQRNIKNPAGWLRRAIQQGFELDLPPASANNSPTANSRTQDEPQLDLHNTPERGDAAPREDIVSGGGDGGEASVSGASVADRNGGPESYPEGNSSAQDDARRMLDSGELDEAISALRELSPEEYSRFVDTKTPIVDSRENRFQLTTDGDLYLYVGEPCPENLCYLTNLNSF